MYRIEIPINNQTYVLELDTDEKLDEKKIREIIFNAQKQKLLPLEQPQQPSKLVQKLAKTQIPERSAVFASHFAPIVNLFLRDDEKQYLTELEKQHPVSKIAGEFTGAIAELPMFGAGVSKATKFLPELFAGKPRLARFLTSGIRTGLTFGAQGVFRETVEQAKNKTLDLEKIGERYADDFLFGAGLGMGEKIVNLAGRTLASGAYAGLFTALQNKFEKQKIRPEDVLLNTGIVSAFTLLTGKLATKQVQDEVFYGLRDLVINKLKTQAPQIGDRVINKTATDFAKQVIRTIYEGGKEKQIGIDEFVEQVIKDWNKEIKPKANVDIGITKETSKNVALALSPVKIKEPEPELLKNLALPVEGKKPPIRETPVVEPKIKESPEVIQEKPVEIKPEPIPETVVKEKPLIPEVKQPTQEVKPPTPEKEIKIKLPQKPKKRTPIDEQVKENLIKKLKEAYEKAPEESPVKETITQPQTEPVSKVSEQQLTEPTPEQEKLYQDLGRWLIKTLNMDVPLAEKVSATIVLTPPEKLSPQLKEIYELFLETTSVELTKTVEETLPRITPARFNKWLKSQKIPEPEIEATIKEITTKPAENWSEKTQEKVWNYIEEVNKNFYKKLSKMPEGAPEPEIEYFSTKPPKEKPPQEPPVSPTTPEQKPYPESGKFYSLEQAWLLSAHLFNKIPQIAKLKRNLGFYKVPTQEIKLSHRIFANDELALYVYLHETGHGVEKLLIRESKRSNILGKLAALHNFTKWTLGQANKETVIKEIEKVVKSELGEFGEARWKIDVKHPNEMYADFFSLILMKPDRVMELAPVSSKLFWEGINKNPEVSKAITTIMMLDEPELIKNINQLLTIASMGHIQGEDLYNISRMILYDKNFNLKEYMKELQLKIKERIGKEEVEYSKQNFTGLGMKLKTILWDTFAPLKTRLEQLYKEGKITADEYYEMQNVMSLYFVNPYSVGFFTIDKFSKTIEKYEGHFTLEDLGTYLIVKRIINPERVANPMGITPANAPKHLEEMKLRLGTEKFQELEQCGQELKSLIDSVMKDCKNRGLIDEDAFKEFTNAERTYVPIKVEKYLEEQARATFKERIGTLEPAKRPVVELISKMAVLEEVAQRNYFKSRTFNILLKNHPDVIKIHGSPLKPVSKLPNQELFIFRENGILQRYLIPKNIADCFIFPSSFEGSLLTQGLDYVNHFVKALFTRKNPMFIVTSNLIRDFTDAFLLPPDVPLEIKAEGYKLARKLVLDFVNGKVSPEIEELVELGIIDRGMWGNIADIVSSKKLIESVERKYFKNIIENQGKINKIIEEICKVGDMIEKLGILEEKIHKVGNYLALKKHYETRGWTKEQIRFFTFKLAGSPDFNTVARSKKSLEYVFLFYNAWKEGIRRLGLAMTRPETRKNFWIKASSVIGTFLGLRLMAEEGFLGEEKKQMYEEMPMYYKINPTAFPIGYTPDGDLVIFAMPVSESLSNLFAFFYAMGKSWKNKDELYRGRIVSRYFGEATKKAVAQESPIIELVRGISTEYKFKKRTLETAPEQISGTIKIILDQTGKTFPIKALQWIVEDKLAGKNLKIYIPLRLPLASRFIKVIPAERFTRNIMYNLGERVKW